MSDLLMIVPSRGRPQNIADLVKCWTETTTGSSQLLVAVDDDDPALDGYLALRWAAREPGVVLTIGKRRRMAGTLNYLAVIAARRHFAVGFMGDDHRPLTPGWDQTMVDALRDLGTGIVYGDDLLQREALPTAVAMTSDIIRALGYMAPPGLIHLALDNSWLALGQGAGCIRYLPDVVIEHLHPFAGKAPMDAGYIEVNAPEMYQRDLAEFERWSQGELPSAIATVRALKAAA